MCETHQEASAELRPALHAIRRRTASKPEMALVLGSGLGDLAEAAAEAVALSAGELPGYPQSAVAGHQGQLVFGQLEGKSVVFIQGRLHAYEGHPARALTFPLRLAHATGAHRMLVTNAAGGIHPALAPGTLMLITSHLNRAGVGPLLAAGTAGKTVPLPTVRAAPYDAAWTLQAERIAREQGLATRRGVYCWVRGPSYETKAEISVFRRLGADAVGMSTVPEVLQARQLGMRVLGLSVITNPAAGLAPGPLTHEDVLNAGRRLRGDLEVFVRDIVRAA